MSDGSRSPGVRGVWPPRAHRPDDDVSLVQWLERNRAGVGESLLESGALRFQGFNVRALAEFRRATAVLSPELIEEYEAPTPRTEVAPGVYTSTEYPSRYAIAMHNEMSHTHKWPMKLWFYCQTPAEQGGQTPVADSRKVFRRIDPGIRKRFVKRRVMYVRNYGEGGDLLSWQRVFGVNDRADVESYCAAAGIDCEWMPQGRLRTRQVRDAALSHPVTGEAVWFNQAHVFHVSNLEGEEGEYLRERFRGREDELAYHTCYGDRTAIETSVLDEIRGGYAEAEAVFEWEKGDVLLLDNMLSAHGRRPYEGKRQVFVGMAEQQTNEGLRLG